MQCPLSQYAVQSEVIEILRFETFRVRGLGTYTNMHLHSWQRI
jgi:hypothetical protein